MNHSSPDTRHPARKRGMRVPDSQRRAVIALYGGAAVRTVSPATELPSRRPVLPPPTPVAAAPAQPPVARQDSAKTPRAPVVLPPSSPPSPPPSPSVSDGRVTTASGASLSSKRRMPTLSTATNVVQPPGAKGVFTDEDTAEIDLAQLQEVIKTAAPAATADASRPIPRASLPPVKTREESPAGTGPAARPMVSSVWEFRQRVSIGVFAILFACFGVFVFALVAARSSHSPPTLRVPLPSHLNRDATPFSPSAVVNATDVVEEPGSVPSLLPTSEVTANTQDASTPVAVLPDASDLSERPRPAVALTADGGPSRTRSTRSQQSRVPDPYGVPIF
jgi:hypothetical protein